MEQNVANTANPAQLAYLGQKLALESQMRSGVNWFFWIAGLSLINSFIYMAGGDLTFVVGLGVTQIIDGFSQAFAGELGGGTALQVVGLVLDIIVAGIFAWFGFLGRRRLRWVVILGMALYTLDGVIFAAFGDWMPVVFHLLALWGLWRGQQAIGALKKLEESQPLLQTSAF
jgi:hypothetical protein